VVGIGRELGGGGNDWNITDSGWMGRMWIGGVVEVVCVRVCLLFDGPLD